MEKRLCIILSVVLLLLGLFFINIEVTIVGAVIGAPSLFSFNSIIGLSLILISGVLFVAGRNLVQIVTREERKARDKTKVMKSLRREISGFKGDYPNLVGHVVDTLAGAFPGKGSSKQEKRELRHLSKTIAGRYGLDRKNVYRDISESLHEEKRMYGRRGR